MSDDARTGGHVTAYVLAALTIAGLGGLGAWTLFGSDPGRTEGSSASAPRAPAVEAASERQPSLRVEIAPLTTQAIAGTPMLLQLRAPDLAGRRLPEQVALIVEGVDAKSLTTSAGFEVREGRVVATTAELDANGTVLVAITGATGDATVRLAVDELTVATIPVSWTAQPDDFVLLLPGQTLDGARVHGAARDLRPGESFRVEIVPVREGRETTFAGVYQGTLTLAASAPRTIQVTGGRTTVTLEAPRPQGLGTESCVEVQGLHTGGVFRSASFRVLAPAGR